MIRPLNALVAAFLLLTLATARPLASQDASGWQQPPADIMEVLHAPQLPWVWTNPTGEVLLLTDPVLYPPLEWFDRYVRRGQGRNRAQTLGDSSRERLPLGW